MKNLLKRFFSTIIFFLLVPAVFAGGKKDVAEKQSENMDSWQETFDITDKKAGKYNIVVTAEDYGGNQGTAGPFNIMIDPDSDLPIVGITNPVTDMRIPGNLNIVGTCIDDDAVGYVELILDGNSDSPIRAEGTEFWSYYLDTTKMAEGQHTIEAYGVDINGVKGHSVHTSWHLDRKQPVTGVENYGIGALVSGKINLSGTVSDGNGIKSLAYSVDGGVTFEPLKLKTDKHTGFASFSAPVDTTKMQDGAAVCWFKAVDNQGTTGLSSFLFFVDNTKPAVRILSPLANEVVNGIFSVTGSAFDVVGMQSLEWSLGEQSGSFELVSGNPYWIKEFDLRNYDKKSTVFTVTATDIAGNVRTEKMTIPVDSQKDCAQITVQYPTANSVLEGTAESLFVRGIVHDDDGAAQLFYSVDGGTEHSVECDGVFTIDLKEAFADKMSSTNPSILSAGSHTITLYAVDVHDIKGVPVTIPFTSQGEKPLFTSPVIKFPKTEQAYQLGMEIHPESGGIFTTNVAASCGISSVEWFVNGQACSSYIPKEAEKDINVSIPLDPTKPWGVVKLEVVAKDIYGRHSRQESLVYLTNLSKIDSQQTVVFEDSSVTQEGVVSFAKNKSITGFFAGGKAASVRLQPETPFATARLEGNTIILESSGTKGLSDSVQVVVTSDRGFEYFSKPLHFANPTPNPEIHLEDEGVSDGFSQVTINGRVLSEFENSLEYRIIPINAQISAEGIMTGATAGKPTEYTKIEFENDGYFNLVLPSSTFSEGIHIVELLCRNFDGSTSCKAHFINKIPQLPSPALDGKKTPKATKPTVIWLEGEDIYYAVFYQGKIDELVCSLNGTVLSEGCYNQAGIIQRGSLKQEQNTLTLAGKAEGNAITSKHYANAGKKPEISFETVAGENYVSGKIAYVPQTQEKDSVPVLTVKIHSASPLKGVSYDIAALSSVANQPAIFGGTNQQSGKALIRKTDDPEIFQADIPLQNIPVQWHSISVVAENATGSTTETCIIGVARPKESSQIVDLQQIHWLSPQNGKIEGLFNILLPMTVQIETATSEQNISAQSEGKAVVLEATECGSYSGIVVKAKDAEGVEYSAAPISMEFSRENPQVNVSLPTENQWLKDKILIDGTASDLNGVSQVEVSFDGGLSWTTIDFSSATEATKDNTSVSFEQEMPLTTYQDGLVPVDIRVTDSLGNTTTKFLSVFKDTTPPQVSIITPAPEDVVNGETTVAFKVSDNGKLVSAMYIPPAGEQVQQEKGNKETESNGTPFELSSTPHLSVGTVDKPMENYMSFQFADVVGNVQTMDKWDFVIDNKSDLPRVEIHLPEDNQIITTDFIISGVVFDDDGKSKISYRIDDGEYITLPEYDSTYSIEIPLSSMTDNEHTVYIYAEDIHGVRGEEVSRKFRISLEEPKGAVTEPEIEKTVKGTVLMKGLASDKNGIALVQVSLDNGNTYNDAIGTEEWSYEFDTRMIQDGTHVVFLRVFDNYGIEGLYSSLITIDNTVPDIKLELPLDDSATSGNIFFSGQTIDNVELVELYITVRALDKNAPPLPVHLNRIDLVPDSIITQVIDISTLPDGFYNVELTGADAGGNTRRVSRNIRLDKSVAATKVDLMYPMNGQHVNGIFNIYGTVTSETPIERMLLFVDGSFRAETQLSSSNAFKFELTPELISAGEHKISVRAQTANSSFVESNTYSIIYQPTGPWVSVDNFTMLDFAANRPFLEGRAGYVLSDTEMQARDSKETPKEDKEAIKQKRLVSVELSFDNGKTFVQVGKNGKWRYRIENDYMNEGYHFILARATMENGETAVTRTIIQIDKTKPQIRLISPGEGGRFNENIEFSGLSSDDVGLKDVTFALRSGDKSSYELPAFIQGLYFDVHVWGATLWDVGVGLTFFDDNVKLQLQFGQFTQAQRDLFDKSGLNMRYGGNVFGMKLLANIAYIPFQYFFGPGWQWLSAGFAIGANFSLFTETQSGKPQMLSAILAQIEFPRVTLDKQKMFRTFSFYVEGQLWFLPTDVQAGATNINSLIPQISAGIRVNVF